MTRVLVTGGAGFISSNLCRHLLRATDHEVVIMDALTYAGNLESLAENRVIALFEDREGNLWIGTQSGIARFDGNRVYLSTPPSPDPLTGTMTMRTMTWEKVT